MSKLGFQLEIQKNLTEEEHDLAISMANYWIHRTTETNNLKFHWGGKTGGWKSYLKRNRFGLMMENEYKDLVFRRISTTKRIFGVVKANTMTKPDGSDVELKQCMCPDHRGGEKVIWKNNKKPATFIYAKLGEIRG